MDLPPPEAGEAPGLVTSISYQVDLEAICLSTDSGQLLLVHDGEGSREVEEVGSVGSGIVAMEWSPDGDVVALITGQGSLLFMNQEWEALAEVPLEAEEPPPSDPGRYMDARLTWRGDGKFVAAGFASSSGRCAEAGNRVRH